MESGRCDCSIGWVTGLHYGAPLFTTAPRVGAEGVVTVSAAPAHDALVTMFDGLRWLRPTQRPAANPELGDAVVVAQGVSRALRVRLVTGEVVVLLLQRGECL